MNSEPKHMWQIFHIQHQRMASIRYLCFFKRNAKKPQNNKSIIAHHLVEVNEAMEANFHSQSQAPSTNSSCKDNPCLLYMFI